MSVPAYFSVIYVKTVTFHPHLSPHLSPLIRLSCNRLSLKVTVWRFLWGKNAKRKVSVFAKPKSLQCIVYPQSVIRPTNVFFQLMRNLIIQQYFSCKIFSISGTWLSRSPAPNTMSTSKSCFFTNDSTSSVWIRCFSTSSDRWSYISLEVTPGIGSSLAG